MIWWSDQVLSVNNGKSLAAENRRSHVLQDSTQGGFLGRWMPAPVLGVGPEFGRRDAAEFLDAVFHRHIISSPDACQVRLGDTR